MSEDELDDIRERAGGRVREQQQSLLANQRTGRRTKGGAKLKNCLSKCCLATVLLWPIRAGGGTWPEQGVGLDGRGEAKGRHRSPPCGAACHQHPS